MSVRYAQTTSVSSEASRSEIERTLIRYGAKGFAYGWNAEAAVIQFEMVGRRIKFVLPMPDRAERRFTHTKHEDIHRQQRYTPERALKEWEQGCRQCWRALLLCIKAKLESVQAGICTFEQEFLAHIVLPNGQTYGEFAIPQIAEAYELQQMPPMLQITGPQ